MKKICFYIVCILCGIVGCQSCYDDKGNYNYHDINELSISGIEETYTMRAGDPISIIPVIDATLPGDEEDYSYEWVWMNAIYRGSYYNAYIWSRLKEWDDFNIGLPSGTYKFYYRVKDNKTGVTWLSDNFTVNIVNDISLGFLVLSDINNVGRLDFINYYRDTFDLRLDILTKLGTEMPPLDKPLGVVCCADDNSPYMAAISTSGENYYMAAILTENGTYRLHPSTLAYEDRYNIVNNFLMDGALPAGFYAKDILYYTSPGSLGIVDNNNNFYYYYKVFQMLWSAGIYTNTTPQGKLLHVSPKTAVISSAGFMMYDVDSLSFVKQTAASATTSNYLPSTSEKEFIYNSDTLLFKYNKTGKDLVYMHCRTILAEISGTCPIYALLKDRETQEFFYGSFRYDNALQLDYFRVRNAPELDKAEDFSMTYNTTRQNYANNYLYYRTDKKIYAYDLLTKEAKLVYETNNIISYFGFIKLGDWRDNMLVCTYDPSAPADNCGKMQIFTVTAPYPDLTIAKHNGENMEWTGFGKIIDVDWKGK